MLDTDEIKARFEELYDAVQVKLKETEGTDEEPFWRAIAQYIWKALDAIDTLSHFMGKGLQ